MWLLSSPPCLQAQLVDASARAAKCDGLYRALKEKVEAQEQEQATQMPIHSQVEDVKKQMEQHKVREVVGFGERGVTGRQKYDLGAG